MALGKRQNCQLTPFVSWKSEPGVWAVNAFSLCWTTPKFYAFPPFSILGRVLAKVQQDGATGMLVTPFWPTQPWFPQLLELLIDHPRMLRPRKDLLQVNGRLDMVHPLHSKLVLLVMIISGQPSKVQAYQQRLQPSVVMPEEREPNSSSTLHRCGEFCRPREIHPVTPPINDVVEFHPYCPTWLLSCWQFFLGNRWVPSMLFGCLSYNWQLTWWPSTWVPPCWNTPYRASLILLLCFTTTLTDGCCVLCKPSGIVTQRTLLAPQIDEFFITHSKPYHPASKDTLARWVKDMLHFGGINSSHYAAHSCHSASSSKGRCLESPWNKFWSVGSGKAPIPLYASTTRILCDLLMLQLSSLQLPSLYLAGDNTLPK